MGQHWKNISFNHYGCIYKLECIMTSSSSSSHIIGSYTISFLFFLWITAIFVHHKFFGSNRIAVYLLLNCCLFQNSHICFLFCFYFYFLICMSIATLLLTKFYTFIYIHSFITESIITHLPVENRNDLCYCSIVTIQMIFSEFIFFCNVKNLWLRIEKGKEKSK